MTNSRRADQVIGIVGIAVVLAVVGGLIGMYQKSFTPVVSVTVQSDRAGLLLDRGAAVRMYDVRIGEVRSTAVQGDSVTIEIALDKGAAKRVPADVRATIRATTVFGAKFVDLALPSRNVAIATGANSIKSGDTILAAGVTTEVNDTFQHALNLLSAIDAEKLNTTLTGMAQALDGRGEKLGAYLTQVNDYLTSFNRYLPTLSEDIRLSKQVATTYADVVGQLIDTGAQGATTAVTLDRNRASLHALLVDMSRQAPVVAQFFKALEQPLVDTIREFTPVSDLLRVYSPEIGCFIENFAKDRDIIVSSIGRDFPGLVSIAGFLPGQELYKPGKNLPKLVKGVGPICYPFPSVERPTLPHVRFDDGTADVYDGVGPTINPGDPFPPVSKKVGAR